MTGSDGSPPRKVQRRGHVTLTEHFNGIDAPGAHVLVGGRIRPEARQRSDLLSGIGNTDGIAALPNEISPDELHLWQAACVVGREPSTAELVTVLKVSDQHGKT